jgi:uncharacterized tellurite resistance protein B-like protein
MSIFDWLGRGAGRHETAESRSELATVRSIVERLEHMAPEQARWIASVAFLLSRVARADLDISAEETRAMEQIVMHHGGLDEAQAVLVVQMAKHQNLLFGGTDNYLVGKELGRTATREQKLALLECLFAVSAADESITTVEDGVVRQIAAELGLEHGEFIAVRQRFREHLAVLRDPRRGPAPS